MAVVKALKEAPALENFVLCIPKVSAFLESMMYRVNRGDSGSGTNIHEGGWIQESEILATCCRIPVFAPVGGKVLSLNSVGYSSAKAPDPRAWRNLDLSEQSVRIELHECTLARIQPFKGSDLERCAAKSYGAVTGFFANNIGFWERRALLAQEKANGGKQGAKERVEDAINRCKAELEVLYKLDTRIEEL